MERKDLFGLFLVVHVICLLLSPGCAVAALAMMVFGKYRDPGQPPSLGILARAIGSFLQAVLFNLGIMTLIALGTDATVAGAAAISLAVAAPTLGATPDATRSAVA